MAPPPRPPDPPFPPPPPPRDLPGRFPRQARPNASYPCLPSSSSANWGKTPGRQTSPPPRPPPEARQVEPPWPSPPAPPGWPEAAWRGRAGSVKRLREGVGQGALQSLWMGTMRSRRDSTWKAGLREAPGERWALEGRFLCRLRVTVRRKPGTPLGVGKRLVLGVGLASPLPSCPLDKPGQKAWGQDGGLSAPGTPSFAPWNVGGFPKHGRAFPPRAGRKSPPAP